MKKLWILASAVLVIAGIAAIVSVQMAEKNADRANDWTQVRAKVERAGGTSVAYQYDAGGATQHATGQTQRARNYRVGDPVLVYVNPANPGDSLLELPPRPPTWPTMAGAVSILIGALLLGFYWRDSHAHSFARKKFVAGDTTGTGTGTRRRRKAPPLARLQPPPAVKWKREDKREPPDAPNLYRRRLAARLSYYRACRARNSFTTATSSITT